MTDFELFLTEIGATSEQMESVRLHMNSVVPPKMEKVAFKPSPIHGLGVFSQLFFFPGQKVISGMDNDEWTAAGRFVNHSKQGNLEAVEHDGGFHFVARIPILPGEEMTVDYRSVRDVLAMKGVTL